MIGFVREPRPCAAKVWLSRYRLLDGGSFAVDYYTMVLGSDQDNSLFFKLFSPKNSLNFALWADFSGSKLPS